MGDAPGHPGDAYFTSIGDRLGGEYLKYSFTKGTAQEVQFLLDELRLPSGARVLDVGCGPGRHAIALAEAGLAVTGVDVSARFLELAREAGNERGLAGRLSLFECDARQMPFDDEFDAVISICQGAFGLMGDGDGLVLRRMMEAAKPGGRVLLTAFSAYYEAKTGRSAASIDVDRGLVHERSSISLEDGGSEDVDLWTGVYTPRELRLLALGVGLVPENIWSVEPGDFARRTPDLEHPEFMLSARRPERP